MKEGKTVMETIGQAGSRSTGKRLRVGIYLAALAVVLAAGVLAFQDRGEAGAMRFNTGTVQQRDLEITVTATGNLEATNQVEVGSELSGTIKAVTADYNDMVALDQPLVYLDDAKYQAAVNKSRAEVLSARANYKDALSTRKASAITLERYRKTRELTGGKLPSEEDLDQAQADLERAEAQVDAARAAIAIAQATLEADETDLNKTVIYAPINGIVLSRDVEAGQTVAASLEAPVLYTLAEDLRHMELLVDIDEADVGLVKEGQPATFTVDAYPEETFTAKITQVRYGAETNDGVVTYETLLMVENPDLLLRPGMTATATITVRKVENTLLVPNTALAFSPPAPEQGRGKKGSRSLLGSLMPGPPHREAHHRKEDNGREKKACVWVQEEGRPVPVPVEKGPSDGILTSVSSPQLERGMEVIINAVSVEG